MTHITTDVPRAKSGQIKLHGPDAFAGMRKAGRLTAEALDLLAGQVRPGVTTESLDRLITEFARDHHAQPAPLNYRGYRKAICTSINHVVCHGIPNDKPLREGDIVNVDVTLVVEGWHGDSSRMYAVGEITRKAERLIQVTYESLLRGIAAVKPHGRTGDIGYAIQTYAEGERCSVVRDFCGHGLGRVFHDHPNILHYGRKGEGAELKPGMFFTIEPMINLGRPHVKILNDGWTAVTRDRSLSAQFEHTVAVTETGYEIFTLSPKGLDFPPISGVTRMAKGLEEAPAQPDYLGHRQRLRERFWDDPDKLLDYELLELLLFFALPRRDTKSIAKQLITRFGDFAEVISATPERIKEVPQVGEVVVTLLKAVDAASRRKTRVRVRKPLALSTWSSVIDYCRSHMARESKEQFRILFLDKKNNLIADELQQKGTVDHTPAYPREVVGRAYELGATAIILVHNHPTGDPTPSAADIEMTRRIKQVGEGMNVAVHDHIIMGRDGETSFRALKLI